MIVDMSASTAPNGSGHSNANAEIAWTGTYPTLMGWNGSNTYGVRVDSARISDSTGNADTVDGYHYNNLPYSANWNDGWGPYNADTIGASKSGFTYAAGAPFSGPLVKFDSSGYDLELNATYHSGGTAIAYRTRNGDAGSWNTWYSLISSANIGSQSVNFANSASYANQLNPLSGDNNYKLAYTADGARTNAGEWGRAVMYYVPNGQTYGIRVDRADAANSAGSVTGGSLSGNLVASNYGIGNMGVYDSTRYQAVWSMGTAWTLPADGTSPGNLYGLAWTHSNAGGQAIGGLSHQLLVMENGATKVALGSGIWTSGNVMASGFIYNSDRNLKKNIATITNPLEKILQLRGVTFDWKKDGKSSVGLIAQEVEEIFPELVSSDGVNKGVQYGNLVAPLIEAVKAQQKEIEELKASQKDFDLLKIRINNLEARAKK